MIVIEPTFHMWIVIATIVVAVISYASEKATLEMTSIGVVAFLVLYFHLFPYGPTDENLLDARRLIAGLADPALISVLGLLVIGQGIVQTGAL